MDKTMANKAPAQAENKETANCSVLPPAYRQDVSRAQGPGGTAPEQAVNRSWRLLRGVFGEMFTTTAMHNRTCTYRIEPCC